MPLTTLDASTALLVIDLQKGIVASAASFAHPIASVVANAAALAAAFRSRQLPVVFVTVTGASPGRTEQAAPAFTFPPDFADIIQELPRHPNDHLVSKQTWGAFSQSGLAAHLQSLGVTQVVIVGIATSIGVESTARQAHEAGFHVTLAIDAMTDRDHASHMHSVTRIFPRLGETGVTQDVLALLHSDGIINR